MTLRERVYAKYNGKCAYTGKPLDSDWQIDHLNPVCGTDCYPEWRATQPTCLLEWENLMNNPIRRADYSDRHEYYKALDLWNEKQRELSKAISKSQKNFTRKQATYIENLMPALRHINHYKFCLSLENFRKRIATLQSRIDKYPKWVKELRNELVANNGMIDEDYFDDAPITHEKTFCRYCYICTAAELFGITPETPFSGKFYFEVEL